MQLDFDKIDKSNWPVYRFDQIADKISESVDPNNTELDKYIGLEHLDPESIHIKRFGSKDDVKGQKLKCYPGDVIFGKRRAYQRKAAVVTKEGFCSAHAFVLRAKAEVIDPKLFPFFLHSDLFMHRAVDISVGGLSPTINWTHLKEEEFRVPPKTEQKKLVELLNSIDHVIQRDFQLLEKINGTLDTSIEKLLHGIDMVGKTIQSVINEITKTKSVVKLDELGDILKGKGIPKKDLVDNGIPCIRYGELYTKHHRIIREAYSYIDLPTSEKSIKLNKHDIVFAGSGETITEIGKSASFIDDYDIYAGSDTLIFRPFDMDGTYLGYLMNSQLVRLQLNKYGSGATVMHIYPSDLNKVQVPKLSRSKQEKIGKQLEEVSKNIHNLENQLNKSKELQKIIINKVF